MFQVSGTWKYCPTELLEIKFKKVKIKALRSPFSASFQCLNKLYLGQHSHNQAFGYFALVDFIEG